MQIKKIGVIGLGVIGSSWTAYFLAKGFDVHCFDVSQPSITAIEQKIKPMLAFFEREFDQVRSQLVLETHLQKVVNQVDFIQESIIEKVEAKQQLMADIEKFERSPLPIASSSSSIMATEISQHMQFPERVIIGHPFNPPHIIPLVEVAMGVNTSEKMKELVIDFYAEIGKNPVLIKKEITGFVANRLQTVVLQECIYLLEQDIISMKDLDTIMEKSLGIRWATGGPFVSFHMGGGRTGLAGFLQQFAPALNAGFKTAGRITLTPEIQTKLAEQAEQTYGLDLQSLEKRRDQKEKEIIDLMKQE